MGGSLNETTGLRTPNIYMIYLLVFKLCTGIHDPSDDVKSVMIV